MNDELAPAAPKDAQWLANQRRWAMGWRRVIFPTVFLVWLVEVATAIPDDSRGIDLVAGYLILVAFCGCYALSIWTIWHSDRGFRWLVAALTVLAFAELPFAHADALLMGVYVCSVTLVRYGERGLPSVVVFTLLAVFLPAAVPSWHDSLDTGVQNGTVIAIPLTGLAMYGFARVVRGNRALADARAELARLAAENERTRIARDLHDLLGHSLTTIAVKAELAERLGGIDVEGALREIEEVAALSRRALGDVRAAVANYRDVNLANELATGRELLRAAGIAAELPPAVDVVDEQTQELFGWVVREGLTNVVRHSRASQCTVRISPSSVEIVDDGVGSEAGCGSGLAGLSERVVSAGGVIEAGPWRPSGWRLSVRLVGAASE